MKKDLSVPWSPVIAMKFISAVTILMMVVGLVSSTVAFAAPIADEIDPFKPFVVQSVKNDLSPALRSIQPLPPEAADGGIREIPSIPLPKNGTGESSAADLDVQGTFGEMKMPTTIVNFEGVDNRNGVLPPDTEGDVGPNHYVQIVNLSFAIWDKSGTLLYGPANNNTIWAGFGGPCESENDGDPIVLYDPFADRWLLSQFALPNFPSGPFYECVAISQTPDPTGAWYRYQFDMPVNKMNDYPKFGVWPDGYYMTVNQYNAGTLSWGGAGAAVYERDAMLVGNPAALIYFDVGLTNLNYGGMLPSDFDGTIPPPAGSPNYFAEWDDSGWIGPNDSVRIWEFHVDWANPGNSTFGINNEPNYIVDTSDVDPNMCGYARNCIPQPGGSNVDAISDRLMFRLQYRNFGGYETLLANHTVDVGSDHAGIHWMELRDSGAGWALQQDGVYAPDADHRWMGSVAMDRDGNIALGYSVSSSQTYPSIRYTGRLAGDPLGTLPQGEASVIAGSGYQTHSSGRWGDYSMMAVDPVDDCTFWYTQEYYAQIGTAPWQTRVGAFQFPTCAGDVPDIQVDPSSFNFEVSIGDTDADVMTIHNVGGAELTFDMIDEETSSPVAYGEMKGTPPAGEPDSSGAISGWIHEYVPPENPTVLTGVSVLAYGLQAGEADRLIALGAIVDLLPTPADLPAMIGNYDVFYPAYDLISGLAPYQADIDAYVQAGGGFVVQQPNVIGPVGMMPAGFEIFVSNEYWPDPYDALVFTAPAATHPITQSLTPADLSGNFDTIYDVDLGPGFTVLATHAVETSSVALAAGPYGAGCIVMHTGNFSPGAYDPGTDAYIDSMFNWAVNCPADAPWLTENPTSGSVAPGMSQPVDVMVDTAGLGLGTYTANIVIFNNDPDENPTIVPVTLEVVPLLPDIEVDPTFVSSSQPPDTVAVKPLDILNVGSADLLWEIFEEEPPAAPQTGKGEWMYRSEEGVIIAANNGGEALAYPSAYRWQPDEPSAPLNILIYADDYFHPAPNTFLDQALQILGLAYTAHYDADFAGFETSLAGGPWDLVLFDNDSYGAPTTTLDALNAYVSGGGKLIFTSYVVGVDPFHPLFATLGITWVGDDNTEPPDPVYWWVPGHPFFNNPESVPEFTVLTGERYYTYGQYVEPVPGFDALAGYTTPGPDPLQAAMILGNGDRTVFKGFLDGQNDADLDTDGLMDGVELWINMIVGLTEPECTPGDIPWVSVNPTSGTTPPAGIDTVDVTFDSAGLGAGTYNGNLCVTSNDPDESLVVVPVELEVFVEPDIELSPPSLYSEQPVDSVRVEQLDVGNVGSADLNWLIYEDLYQIVPVDITGSTNLNSYSLSSDASFTAPTQETQRTALIGIDTLVNDGSFENGPPPASAWTETSSTGCEWIGDWSAIWGVAAFDGIYDFWGGGYCDSAPSTDTVSQSITVPVTENTLSFWYISFRGDLDDPDPDVGQVAVDGTPVWSLDLILANNTYPDWVNVTLDLSAYAGQTINLEFAGISTGSTTGNIRFDYIEWMTPDICSDPLDIPWITNIDPPSGTTGPGGTTPVDVTFDSTGMAEGAYNGNLCVESNDPDESLVVVPVSMDVTPPIGEADLWIEPPTSEVPILGETTVDIMVGDVTNLYGVQLDLAFDPAIVEVVGAQLTPGTCPLPDFVVVNEADNVTGTISYAATSLSPSPPCSPGGVVASITFRGLAEGTSPVAFSSWLLADIDGFSIPLETVTDGSITVILWGEVEGYVALQGRTDHSGAEVCGTAGGPPICTTTDPSGYYLLGLPQDTYDITVEMERYLDGEKLGVFVPAGGLVTLPSVTLLGGDAIEDDVINIFDLSFMGSRFGLSVGDPGWDPQADINNDLTINILDIVLAAGNFLQTSPVPWP